MSVYLRAEYLNKERKDSGRASSVCCLQGEGRQDKEGMTNRGREALWVFWRKLNKKDKRTNTEPKPSLEVGKIPGE